MADTIVRECPFCGKHYEPPALPGFLNDPAKVFCCRWRKSARLKAYYKYFWDWVDQSGGPNSCWPWEGSVSKSGYGALEYRGQFIQAHRHAYTLVNGPIPKTDTYHGTVIRHTCDNPRCVNPAHMVLGTQADNGRDMATRGRAVAKLTEEQVIAIRADTRPYSRIKEEYGLCLATISEIKRRLIWKHIP